MLDFENVYVQEMLPSNNVFSFQPDTWDLSQQEHAIMVPNEKFW